MRSGSAGGTGGAGGRLNRRVELLDESGELAGRGDGAGYEDDVPSGWKVQLLEGSTQSSFSSVPNSRLADTSTGNERYTARPFIRVAGRVGLPMRRHDRHCRPACPDSLAVHPIEVSFSPEGGVTRRGACGLWHGGARSRNDRHAFACGIGIRGHACAVDSSVDRCVSSRKPFASRIKSAIHP